MSTDHLSIAPSSTDIEGHVDDMDVKSSAGVEVELRNLILAWRKYCRNLREVQFICGFAWRRAYDGDEWIKRVFEYGRAKRVVEF